MATSYTPYIPVSTVAFVESFVRFVWFCYIKLSEQDSSSFTAAMSHWHDGETDYYTGQSIIVVPEDEVYDPHPDILNRAKHLASLYWKAIAGADKWDWNHDPEVADKGDLATFIAYLAMSVAEPIFDEARKRTKWNETPRQYDMIYKPIARGRALEAIWRSVREAL